MTELLALIKTGFLQRTSDLNEQKKIWVRLSEQFRPDLALYRAGRPSTIIARETGDLGLAVLWIVQAVLTRPILNEIALKSALNKDLSSMLMKLNHNSLCALAHSENPAAPVILAESGGDFALTGEKKFLTAGKNADMIFVTCRKPGEEKISHVAVVPPSSLPENSLPELDLKIMKSVCHTRLVMNNTGIKHFQVADIPPDDVRRMMKKWGILERSLIMETFLSFLLYAEKILAATGAKISEYEEIYPLMQQQSESVTKQIDEAVYNGRIETENIPLQTILPVIAIFKKAYAAAEENLHEADRIKLKDLFMFDNLKG